MNASHIHFELQESSRRRKQAILSLGEGKRLCIHLGYVFELPVFCHSCLKHEAANVISQGQGFQPFLSRFWIGTVIILSQCISIYLQLEFHEDYSGGRFGYLRVI